jgi:hypothetical protein
LRGASSDDRGRRFRPPSSSDQFGLRLQLVGDTTRAAVVRITGSPDSFTARYFDTDGRLVAALAANRPAEVAALRRDLAAAA